MKKFVFTPLLFLLALATSFGQDPVYKVPGQNGQTYINYSTNDNILYAAPYRFSVTSTLQNDRRWLAFDNDFDHAAITIPANGSTTLSIDLRAKGEGYIVNPAGYIDLNFLDMHNPDSIYLRLYDSTGDFADFNFSDWSNASTTSPYLLWRIHVPIWLTFLSKIEVTLFAPSTDSCVLTELDYYMQYPKQFEGGIVSKFTNNTLWTNFYFRDTNNVQSGFIKANGNVNFKKLGIGVDNANDTFKLSVAGAIRTRKVRVDQDLWPDYVFSKEYKLPSLADLNKYITKNHHLPGVPSADEVKLQGVDLGQVQSVMLEKIEELTLHVIKQDEVLKKQKVEMQKMKRKIQTLNRSVSKHR